MLSRHLGVKKKKKNTLFKSASRSREHRVALLTLPIFSSSASPLRVGAQALFPHASGCAEVRMALRSEIIQWEQRERAAEKVVKHFQWQELGSKSG
jgi:hypothetical protein